MTFYDLTFAERIYDVQKISYIGLAKSGLGLCLVTDKLLTSGLPHFIKTAFRSQSSSLPPLHV